MKTGDGNGPQLDGGGLLERMQRAHRLQQTGGADEVEEADEVGALEVDVDIDALDDGGEVPGALEQRLLETAERALEGAFASDDEVRAAVVDAIVDERYAEHLPDVQADQIRRTVQASLEDDPHFCREVDRMLLLAAHKLGD